ncbi:MAG: ATP-binding protein [Candidatus Pacebacteria bacterium]|nr:ATP-binding protein [Candidatus Paceibacterota bacterium]
MIEEKVSKKIVSRETLKKELQGVKEDLNDLEGYMRDLSLFLPLAVCTINPAGIIVNINKAFERMTGYQTLEIVGEPLEGIFFEKELLKKTIISIGQEERAHLREVALTTKKEEKIPVALSIAARKDDKGSLIGCFVALTDISSEKKLREGLEKEVEDRTGELQNSRRALMNILEDVEESRKRAEEERNKTLAIIKNFSDGLIVLDFEKKVSLANPQAEKFFNIASKDVVGKNIFDLTGVPTLVNLIDILKKEDKVFRRELVLDKNLTIEVSASSMILGSIALGTLIILHDITREKTIEAMKTEFVSLSAHQLRTPLAAIKWSLQMFLEGDMGEINEGQKDLIGKAYQSNERMIALINDLLDVTRIEEGKYLFKPTLSDFGSVINFVVNSHKEEAKRKNIKVVFKKPGDKFPKILIDVEKMRLVIQNLLENAIKYTLPGGQISISLKDYKKEILFEISDTGVGIPKDQQGRIFSKFFRGSNVIRMETEGSGLGVFLSKNIIDAHGGKIWFESEEKKGTAFYFTIPVKKEFEEFLKEF